jgi:hypothetical protein
MCSIKDIYDKYKTLINKDKPNTYSFSYYISLFNQDIYANIPKCFHKLPTIQIYSELLYDNYHYHIKRRIKHPPKLTYLINFKQALTVDQFVFV